MKGRHCTLPSKTIVDGCLVISVWSMSFAWPPRHALYHGMKIRPNIHPSILRPIPLNSRFRGNFHYFECVSECQSFRGPSAGYDPICTSSIFLCSTLSHEVASYIYVLHPTHSISILGRVSSSLVVVRCSTCTNSSLGVSTDLPFVHDTRVVTACLMEGFMSP